jgi:hypothetical protein
VPLGDQCHWRISAFGGQCLWEISASRGSVPLIVPLGIYAAGGGGFPPDSTSSWSSACRVLRTTYRPLVATYACWFLQGLFWRWGAIVALSDCDASRERCPCLQWPVDPLGELHSGVNALSRRSEGGVGMSSWPSVVVIHLGAVSLPSVAGRSARGVAFCG